jgi:CHAT domain-containing protein/tetratricopeptide (TPR) repeat protein
MQLRLKFARLVPLSLFLFLTVPLLLVVSVAVPAAQAQSSSNSRDSKVEADRLLNLGLEQFNHSQFEAALQSWQQALTLYQAIHDRKGEGNALGNLGIAYDCLGDYAKAIDYQQQSLAIAREIGDRQGEGQALGNLGIAYGSQGDYAKAIDYLQQTLAIVREIGDRRSEGAALGNLGNAYRNLGDYAKAIDYHQQRLAIARQIGDREGEGGALGNLGNAYFNLGDYAKAIDYHQQALAIDREIGNRQGEGQDLGNLGIAYDSLGEYAKAIDYQQQALAIDREIGDRQGEGQDLENLGNAYDSLGDYAKAIDYHQQALAITREIGDRESEGIVLSNIGDVLKQQNQSDLAIVFYKQSVNVREGIRQSIQTLAQSQQESYTQTVASTYRQLADLLLSQGRVLEAQQVLELLKIQELRDYTRDARAGGTTQGSPLTPPEAAVVPPYNSVVTLGLQLTECERQQPPCGNRNQLQSQRNAATAAFNQQVVQLRALAEKQRNNDPAQLALQELTVAAQKVVLAQPKTVLVYPLVLEDKLWLVWGTQAGNRDVVFASKLVAVSRKDIAQAAVDFRQLLADPNSNLQQLQQVSQKLYHWLVEPLQPELEANGIKNLVFSLDRSTRYIPMAALFDGQHYLIEQFTVSTILTAGLTDTTDKLSATLADNRVMGLGLTAAVSHFAPLRHVREELNQIVRGSSDTTGIYPGAKLFDTQFTRDSLLQGQLGDYRILHIATHAYAAPNPDDSYLVVGDGNTLKSTEISNIPGLSGIHLVVLSACETAQGGPDKDGIEVSGLSYYFLTSGAKSVIASLWSVNDGSTSQLMEEFYKHLSTGNVSEAEALQQAQMALIRSNASSSTNRSSVHYSPGQADTSSLSHSLSHPFYWAPFVLVGDGL